MATEEGAVPAEPTGPFPPRYWWLKRFVVAGLLVFLALGGLRYWWGWKTQKLFAAYLDGLHARGESLDLADLNPTQDIPPADNAATFLMQAAAVANARANGPANSMTSFPDGWPYDATWQQMAEQAVAANARVFPLVRQARSLHQSDFGVRVTSPSATVLLPHLNTARMLANLVADSALRAHFKGDDAAAIETIRDVRAMGPPLDAHPFPVCHLVRIGIDALALDRLLVMAPELTIADEPDGAAAASPMPVAGASVPPRPASRQQVRELIAELVADDDGAGMRRALAGERAMQVDSARWLTRDLPLMRPMFNLDIQRVAQTSDMAAAAARQPDWPAAQTVLAGSPPYRAARSARPMWGGSGPTPFPTLMSNVLGFSAGLAIQQDLRIRAERRMAAVALAVRLYRLDHAGRWPASLQELVPQYLPAVPTDPLAPTGTPLGYVVLRGALPDGSDRPLVYHVGENGVDDTAGKPSPAVPANPTYSWVGKSPDQWRDLKRWTRLT